MGRKRERIFIIFILLITMILLSFNPVLADTQPTKWQEATVEAFRNSIPGSDASLYSSLLTDPANRPTTSEEWKDWEERYNAFKESVGYNSIDANELTRVYKSIKDSIDSKEDSSTGNIDSDDYYKGIYSNWWSVPLEEYDVAYDDLESAEKLYNFLTGDQIGIENMGKDFLIDYIDRIEKLKNSKGFNSLISEPGNESKKATLEGIYGNISQNEKAMDLIKGTEQWDLVNESISSSVANGGHADTIYTSQPHKNDTGNAGDSLDDVMNDADEFVGLGEVQYGGDLATFSNTIYNILLSIGVIVAVIVGAIIGVKLMASNIDTKVEAKKLLIPYVVGCVVVFGGFAIWKIVVSILQGM